MVLTPYMVLKGLFTAQDKKWSEYITSKMVGTHLQVLPFELLSASPPSRASLSTEIRRRSDFQKENRAAACT